MKLDLRKVVSRVPRVRQHGLFELSLAGYAVLGIAALVLALIAGHKVYSVIEDSVWNEVRKEKEEVTKRAALKAHGASQSVEKGNAKARIVYRTITKSVDRYIDRPVYRNVCFDDDGLRDANAALAGQIAPTGKPDKPMPKSGTAG